MPQTDFSDINDILSLAHLVNSELRGSGLLFEESFHQQGLFS